MMARMATLCTCIMALCLPVLHSCGQQYDTSSTFNVPVQLDAVTISSGFDVQAFIRRVRTDTTFYKAFRSMHLVPYRAINDMQVYSKGGGTAATYHSITRQHIANHCRTMTVEEQQATGDFYGRKGNYNYYTAELFASLFFTQGQVCNEDDIVAGNLVQQGSGQMEKHKYELKQLIFNPGSHISGIPFMGDKASIFDAGEAEKYDFRISREQYRGEDCFVFRIRPRKGYERKVVYNELTTWFRKSDYSIVARDYSVSYSTWVYDFDVHMRVLTTVLDGKLYPTYIAYDGNWHVFSKARERVRFTVNVTY